MRLVWQFVEGKFLLVQVVAMLAFAMLGLWIWYRAIHLYVPAPGEPGRCLTGVGIAFFMILLTEVYSFIFALWQFILLRRRWEGEMGWAGTAWVVLILALFPAWIIFNWFFEYFIS